MLIPREKEYMKSVHIPDLRKQPDTLCWDCGKALNHGCPWVDCESQAPVEGWRAKKTRNGYLVIECPEFYRESWCRGRYRSAEDYIYALEQAVKQKSNKVDKYRDINHKLRKAVNTLLWQLNVHMSE